MFLLDSLLIGGIQYVLDKVATIADQEVNDPERQRERLLEAQMQLELGEISEKAFTKIERDVLARMREIRRSRPGALTLSPHDKITGIEIETYKEEGQG